MTWASAKELDAARIDVTSLKGMVDVLVVSCHWGVSGSHETLDYQREIAEAVVEAGADVVQLDEPWLQAHADDAREFGVPAINKALEGVIGTTGLHLCFGYAAVVKNKASEYAFLAELDESAVDLVSIEAAQPDLDMSVLAKLPSKTMVVGVIDLEDAAVEPPEAVAAKVREALKYRPPEQLMLAPDCGMKYLPRDVAFGKLQAMVRGVELVRSELR